MKAYLLKNPHTGRVPTQRVTANVSIEIWDAIRAGGSMIHGFQDKFISMLLQKFYDITHQELPKAYDITSEEAIASLLARLTLAPDSGTN